MLENKPEIEVLWKKPLDAEGRFGYETVIYEENIFYITLCQDTSECYGSLEAVDSDRKSFYMSPGTYSNYDRCIKVFDLKGNKKWEYVAKNTITSYSFSKGVLALAIHGEGIEGLNLNGEHLWEYRYKNIEKYAYAESNIIESICISERYLAFCNAASCVFFLELDKNNKWCLKWMYNTYNGINVKEGIHYNRVWNVRIYKDSVFAIADSFVYCFDMNGNIKWRRKCLDGDENIAAIDENKSVSWSMVWVNFHNMDETIKFLPKDSVVFGISVCGGYIGVAVEEMVAVEDGEDDYEISNTLAYLLDKNGKVVNKFVREKQKSSNPNANTTPRSTSLTPEYIVLGTFDGYLYLFDIEGKWKVSWHSQKINEKWLNAHAPKIDIHGHTINECWDNGIVYGDTYGDYYPILSLSLSNSYISVLLPNELALLKIKK